MAGEYKRTWNLGPPTYNCQYRGDILWYVELTNKSTNTQTKFAVCCMEDRVIYH